MKINDRNLIHFASSSTPVDREGWLLKRGEVNKSFQKRWCLLKGNLLFYSEKKTDKEPIGVIILEGCTVELAENEEQFTFKVVFHGSGNRTYILCADSQENMEGWMKALACASYDYMKLMVIELQRQLDEVQELEQKKRRGVQNILAVGGLPVNLSDSCLCSHQQGGTSGRIQRTNPFDNNVTDHPNSANGSQVTRPVKYSFLELHETYGQKFIPVFDAIRRKKMANSVKEGELIKF